MNQGGGGQGMSNSPSQWGLGTRRGIPVYKGIFFYKQGAKKKLNNTISRVFSGARVGEHQRYQPWIALLLVYSFKGQRNFYLFFSCARGEVESADSSEIGLSKPLLLTFETMICQQFFLF